MIYYIKSIHDNCIEYTTNEAEAANGICKSPKDNERFRFDGEHFWETGGIYKTGEPPRQGYYYDCLDKDGNEVRLRWFVCNLNAKKRYYQDAFDLSRFGTVKDGIRYLPESESYERW